MIGKLDAEQLQQIFIDRVAPEYLDIQRGEPTGSPRFVSVGGQPGAGKGAVLDIARSENFGSVVVNGDDLRLFHPDYEGLMESDPLRMPEVTGSASGPWVGMSTRYLRLRQISAIVETTLRDAEMLRGEFEAFRAAGYVNELRVVAVPLEVSRAGTVTRFIQQIKDYGSGRWTPSVAHDQAAVNVTNSVRELVSSGVVDRIVIQDRDGRVFLDAGVTGGGLEAGNQAAGAVDFGRKISTLTQGQAQDWVISTAAALRERAVLSVDFPVLNDKDLLKTVGRLVGLEARPIIIQAYPDDVGLQKKIFGEFEALKNDCAIRSLSASSFGINDNSWASKTSLGSSGISQGDRNLQNNKGLQR